jgi:hypothetical protein
MFSPRGRSLRELAMQALSSVEGGYDLLAPKFDHTPFRTSDCVLDATADALRPLGPFGRGLDVCCGTGAGRLASPVRHVLPHLPTARGPRRTDGIRIHRDDSPLDGSRPTRGRQRTVRACPRACSQRALTQASSAFSAGVPPRHDCSQTCDRQNDPGHDYPFTDSAVKPVVTDHGHDASERSADRDTGPHGLAPTRRPELGRCMGT